MTLDKIIEKYYYENALNYEPLNKITNEGEQDELLEKIKFFYRANRDLPLNEKTVTNIAKTLYEKKIELMDTTKEKIRNLVKPNILKPL